MANYSNSSFEIIPFSDIKDIVSKDLSQLTTDSFSEKYARMNAPTYYVLLNTWLNLWNDYSPITGGYLRDNIKRQGLISIISLCSDEASKVIRKEATLLPLTRELIADVNTVAGVKTDEIVLLLLRFPKRFSPVYADKVKTECIRDVLAVENRCKLLQRRELSLFWTERIREVLARVCKPFTRKYKIDPKERYFSDGVCADGKRLYEKVDAIFSKGEHPWGMEYLCYPTEFTDIPYNLYSLGNKYSINYREWKIKVNLAVGTCVPKTYKTGRFIAPEEAYRQYNNTAIYASILRMMEGSRYWKEFCITDQEKNRGFCRKASIDNSYATIDITHASDCHTKTMFRTFFPKCWVDLIDPVLPNYIKINEKVYPLQMTATAGCVLTFVLETLLFWAIARAVAEEVARWDKSVDTTVSVYGDDIICSKAVAPTLIEVLEALGFMPNKDKSFYGDENYRETCGAEYYKGVDVSSTYWPRKALKWDGSPVKITRGPRTEESLVSIVELEHKLYQYGSRRACAFLCTFVRSIIPDFTSSDPAAGLQDLWETFPVFETGLPPHKKAAKTVVPLEATRELHYVPVSKVASSKTAADTYQQCYAVYQYVRFLQHGPLYEDELSRLLGVTMKTPSISQGLVKPTTKYIKKLI